MLNTLFIGLTVIYWIVVPKFVSELKFSVILKDFEFTVPLHNKRRTKNPLRPIKMPFLMQRRTIYCSCGNTLSVPAFSSH